MYEILDAQRMDEYAQGLNNHIRRSEEFTSSMREVVNSLNEIRHSREHQYLYEVKQLREDFKMLLIHLERQGMSSIDVYGYRFEQLAALVHTEEWPQAIDPDYIVVNDDAKRVTATHILDLIVTEYLDGLKFLDFGCGGGFVAHQAASRKAAVSVGYDPKGDWRCNPADRFLLTDNLEETRKHAPYDIILMYDVLDHCENPLEALHQAKELLSNRGRIYVRNHPWCSKHGGHLYEHVNKAYVHVIFDEVEQMRLFGRTGEFVQKLPHPIITYREWFHKSGLEILTENPIREESIPSLFSSMDNTHIQERLAKHWKGGDATDHLPISFVQYLLEPSQKDLF